MRLSRRGGVGWRSCRGRPYLPTLNTRQIQEGDGASAAEKEAQQAEELAEAIAVSP
jgi:hypothetical protein